MRQALAGAAFAVLAALPAAAAAQAAPGLEGTTWRTATNSGIVRLDRCGASICGTIIRVLPPEAPDATDRNNPDPALRARTVRGLRILSGFSPGPNGSWRDGQIYNPEDGRTYRSHIRRLPDGRLRVNGCVGPLCLTQHWTAAQ